MSCIHTYIVTTTHTPTPSSRFVCFCEILPVQPLPPSIVPHYYSSLGSKDKQNDFQTQTLNQLIEYVASCIRSAPPSTTAFDQLSRWFKGRRPHSRGLYCDSLTSDFNLKYPNPSHFDFASCYMCYTAQVSLHHPRRQLHSKNM